MSGMHITTDLLRERGADCDHLGIFAAEWPDGVEMTPASLRRAGELHLNMEWVWNELFPQELKDRERFRPLDDAWCEQLRQIGEGWREQLRQLDDAHLEQFRPIDEAFWTALAELMAELMEAA